VQTLFQPAELRDFVGCHLVPTMGALHEGHASLVRRARTHADSMPTGDRPPVVVTIFVNPTQFAPHEDFARYPRTLDSDLALARDAGADAVFVPCVATIYPRGLDAAQRDAAAWDLPPAATEPGLEDRVRPGHFGGVCLVVARLFELCRPRRAFFGEKDWQQLRVVAQMAGAARFGDLEIVPCPTVRDPDGLAMSSRNRYLGAEERRRATALWRGIEAARAALAGIARVEVPAAERAAWALIEGEGLTVDYAVVRDAETLLPVTGAPRDTAPPLRILVAARLGAVRLIDNAPTHAASAPSA